MSVAPDLLRMSPSSADRWSACPGSVTLSWGKKEVPKRYSAEGTVAHGILAECLEWMVDPQSCIGRKVTQDGFEIEVDQEMADGVASAIAVIEDLQAGREDWTVLIESEFESKAFPTRGYVDFGLISTDRKSCVIVDFKYGKGIMVPVEDNPQLLTYAVMLSEQYQDLESFQFVVVQPRARTGKTIKMWEANRGNVSMWVNSMIESHQAIVASNNHRKDPLAILPFLQEGSHCQFCAAKPECPKLLGFAQVAAETAKTEIREWGAAECQQWLDRLDALEGWISAVRGRAFQLLEDGEPIAGWKLVDSVGHRKWKVPPAELVDILRDKGFQKKALITEVLVSPAQVEKLKLPRSLSRDGLVELMSSLTERPSKGRTLAKDDDPRDSVGGNSVAEDFADPV